MGKDTQAKKIAKYYQKKGNTVILRSHPSDDTFFGKQAKKALFQRGKVGKIKASIFFMLDVLLSIRKYYRPKEEPILIMVRYLIGTAYLPKGLVRFAYTFFEHFVPTSDYMFFLDAPTVEILKRIERRENKEIFETYEALENVRNKAMMVTKKWHIIDTTTSIDESYDTIVKVLEALDQKINYH